MRFYCNVRQTNWNVNLLSASDRREEQTSVAWAHAAQQHDYCCALKWRWNEFVGDSKSFSPFELLFLVFNFPNNFRFANVQMKGIRIFSEKFVRKSVGGVNTSTVLSKSVLLILGPHFTRKMHRNSDFSHQIPGNDYSHTLLLGSFLLSALGRNFSGKI